MSISIITTYQQYIGYMAVIEFQRANNPELFNIPQIEPNKARKIRYISAAIIAFGGTLLLISGFMGSGVYRAVLAILGLLALLRAGYLIKNTESFINLKNNTKYTNYKEVNKC